MGLGAIVFGAWSVVATLGSTTGPISWSMPVPITSSSLIPPSATGYSMASVSCNSATLCVAGSGDGYAVSATEPTAGAGAWSTAVIDGEHTLSALACPSVSLCVAGDNVGNVVTSTEPTAGAGAWHTATIDAGRRLQALSCPTASLCVAVDEAGNAITSTEPTAGAGAWHTATIDAAGQPLLGVSCPSASLCVAVDQYGDVLSSTEPTGGPSAWNLQSSGDPHSLSGGVSCPSASLCVAADSAGDTVVSTNPTGWSGAWSTANVGGAVSLDGVSCPSVSLCVLIDSRGDVLASTEPTGGANAWKSANIGRTGTDSLTGVSCPSELMCVVVDGEGYAVIGTGSGLSQPPASVNEPEPPRPLPAYTLSVSLVGLGRGEVSGAGIACPPGCSASYPPGTAVQLRATPSGASTFAGWGGACAGTGQCIAIMQSNEVINATFARRARRPAVSITRATFSSQRHLARFRFRASGVRRTQCALVRDSARGPRRSTPNGVRYSNCRSPVTYTSLRAGSYTFYVRARTPADAEAARPAKRSFVLK